MRFTTKTIVAVATLLGIATAESNYKASCDSWGNYSDNMKVMWGYCLQVDGTVHYTELDLNQCITNNFGVLEAQDMGDFAETCSGCKFTGNYDSTYQCYACYVGNGENAGRLHVQIDLNEIVGNEDGNLVCFGHE